MKPHLHLTQISRLVRDVRTDKVDPLQVALFILTILIASILVGSLAAAFAGAF